jgi:hypothetical protein
MGTIQWLSVYSLAGILLFPFYADGTAVVRHCYVMAFPVHWLSYLVLMGMRRYGLPVIREIWRWLLNSRPSG